MGPDGAAGFAAGTEQTSTRLKMRLGRVAEANDALLIPGISASRLQTYLDVSWLSEGNAAGNADRKLQGHTSCTSSHCAASIPSRERCPDILGILVR